MTTPFRKRLHTALLLVAATTLAGCTGEKAKPDAKTESAPPSSEKSTAQTAIDGMTGKTAVQAGRKARATISRINVEREADMKALGEDAE